MIYFIVAVSMRVFADISKETLPKRRIWVNIESLVYLTLEYLSLESLVYLSLELSISFINCAQEGASLISKQRAVKKKMHICVNIKATRTNGFRVFWKLCLNLFWRKWLRPRRSLVRYLISLQLWQLNTLFRDSLISFNKFFLKTLRVAVLRKLGTNLFHSITLDGKKDFLKKLYLVWRRVILSVFLVL